MVSKTSKPGVVVGVHGLENKPPLDEMKRCWKAAIDEGLARNCEGDQRDIAFEFVYWADLRHGQPLFPEEIQEPYYPGPGTSPFPGPDKGDRQTFSTLAQRVYKGLDWIQTKTGYAPIDDLILKIRFDDLWRYQVGTPFAQQARQRVCEQLKAVAGQRTVLVTHSMGSLIAYDVLRTLEREDPSLWIDHFVSFGSPMGLAEVRLKVADEHGAIRAPNNVGQWSNLSDKRDVATVADALSKDYAPSDRGMRVCDVAVLNDYHRSSGKPYHHLSYGYLRTPEFSEIIQSAVDCEI